jgi:glycogen synthase
MHMTCTIVGDGPLRSSLEDEARELGINTMVTFRGWASRSELPEYFRSHTVFVSPSSEEGMPNTVLEAMASGLPIIATNIPGINELVVHERTGILIQDPSDLAGAILHVYHQPAKRLDYAQQARESAHMHSWKKVADAYNALCI